MEYVDKQPDLLGIPTIPCNFHDERGHGDWPAEREVLVGDDFLWLCRHCMEAIWSARLLM